MPRFKVLIAEDSQFQIRLLERQLSPVYDLVLAMDGEQAIEKLKSGADFLALVLDVRMPHADGFEVLKYIRDNKINIKTVVVSAQPRQVIEVQGLSLGMDYFIPKPADSESLLALLEKWMIERGGGTEGKSAEKIESEFAPTIIDGKKYPFESLTKCCLICGFDQVRFHSPIAGAYSESWESGLFPEYESNEGYEQWDFLKSYVTVCPYCFFASSKKEDFGEQTNSPFPYNEDAKKILSRTISSRRKLLSEVKEVDKRFNNPDRDLEKVMDSLKLAEKCMNGLILGGKVGAYTQIGVYQLLLGGVYNKTRKYYYERALESFYNQLKQSELSEEDVLTSNYFIMSLQMTLHSSESAKKQWDWVEDRYIDGVDNLKESEKIWLDRIVYLWDHGAKKDVIRVIE